MGDGEFGRGWPVVAAGFIGIAGSFASLYFYTAGLFIKPVAAEFGWSRGEASLSAVAIFIGSFFAMPVAGRLIDRHGEAPVAFACGSLLGLCFAMLGALTSGLASFLLLVMLLVISSSGANLMAYNRAIVRQFKRRRGLALGLAMTGTVVGAALTPPLLAPFIAVHGWRAGYYVLAVMALVLTGVATLMLRRAAPKLATAAGTPAERTALVPREIYGRSSFYTIAAIIFLAATAVLGTIMHLVPMLTDGGMDVTEAGRIAAVLGLAVLAGRVATGYVLDRFDAGWVTWALLTLSAGGMLALWTGDPKLVVPGAVLVGLGLGTEADLLAYLLGRRFPVRHFGSVYGAILAVHALGAGVGGLLAGATVDWTGGYGSWLLVAAACMIGAGLIALATERNVCPITE